MFTTYYDKLLLGIALIILIGFSVIFFQRSQQIVEELDTDIPPVETGDMYEMTPDAELTLSVEYWSSPGPQSAGPLWLYDVFTPPSIYYDPVQDIMTPISPGIPPTDEEVIVVEFVEFREAPYRIQLRGYVGSEGDYLISFRNEETGAHFITRRGREVEGVDIEVLDFQVVREETNGVITRNSFAVILDRRTGEEVTLHENEIRYMDEPAVSVRTNEEPPRTINARVGETFDVGPHTYRVLEYTVDPPEIILEKTWPDREEPERRTLRPGGQF